MKPRKTMARLSCFEHKNFLSCPKSFCYPKAMALKSFLFNKIIRDKVYKMLLDTGAKVTLIKDLTDEKILHYFKEKLLEESKEVFDADSQENLVEELADCLEVIHGIAKTQSLPFESIERKRIEKYNQKGGFEEAIAVDFVQVEEDSPLAKYYLEHSKKYPKK